MITEYLGLSDATMLAICSYPSDDNEKVLNIFQELENSARIQLSCRINYCRLPRPDYAVDPNLIAVYNWSRLITPPIWNYWRYSWIKFQPTESQPRRRKIPPRAQNPPKKLTPIKPAEPAKPGQKSWLKRNPTPSQQKPPKTKENWRH